MVFLKLLSIWIAMDLIWLIKFVIFTAYPFYLTIRKILLYIVAPALVYANPSIMSRVICQNRPMPWAFPWPFAPELDQPQKLGLENSKHFRIKTKGGQVAVWHVPPRGEEEGCAIGSGDKPVIVYCHGNTDTRGKFHRILLYQKFVKLGYHVIAFDYRGFADSEDIRPTEESMVDDAFNVYDHVDAQCAKGVPIFLWGHSLGTGVVCALAMTLESSQVRMPRGIILEAAFYNIADLLKNHPDFAPWAGMIFYERHFLDALLEAGFEFRNCDHVTKIGAPILLLHADDDPTIRFEIGFRLYQNSKMRKNKMTREFYGFVGNRGFEHNRIVDAEEFSEIVDTFIFKTLVDSKPGAHRESIRSDTIFLQDSNTNALTSTNATRSIPDSSFFQGSRWTVAKSLPIVNETQLRVDEQTRRNPSKVVLEEDGQLLNQRLDELEELVQSDTSFHWSTR